MPSAQGRNDGKGTQVASAHSNRQVQEIAKRQAQQEVTEKELQSAVLQIALACGWRRFHARPGYAPGRGKWATQMSGEKGLPDLILLRPPRLIFAELKSPTGKTSKEQDEWLADLEATPTVEAYLWRPADLDAIARILSPAYVLAAPAA